MGWLALCLCWVPQACACINDSASVLAEKEFKSSYKAKPQVRPAESQPNNHLMTWTLSGMGSAFLLGAVFLTVRGPIRRNTSV
jgi:hypothetical protein